MSKIVPFPPTSCNRIGYPEDFPEAFQDTVNDLGSRDALGQPVPRVLFEWPRQDGSTARLLWVPASEFAARTGNGGAS